MNFANSTPEITMRALDSRLSALEKAPGKRKPLLLIIQPVTPGHLDVCPSGTHPAPPYLPAVDRMPGETWDEFCDRLHRRIAHLPPGTVVRVVSRLAPE